MKKLLLLILCFSASFAAYKPVKSDFDSKITYAGI